MSSPHTRTSGMDSSVHQVDEEEDDDICPICEGACTCNTKIIPPICHQAPNQSSSQIIRSPPTPTIPTLPKRQSKNTDASNEANALVVPQRQPSVQSPHAGAISNVKDKKFTRPKSTAKDTTGKSSKCKTRGSENDRHTKKGPRNGTALSRKSHDTDAGGPMTAYNPNQDFPTFVSADEFSSANESSAESELTDFSDSNFHSNDEELRTRAHDKARVKRELLGDGLAKRKERQTDWEIRSRTKSVSPSVNDMDDEDEDDVGSARRSYVGIATGWSEGEESSFDADLFFAGLGDSDSGLEPPTIHSKNATADTDDDNSSLDIEPPSLGQGVFEITEGWDGSVIFTNGLQDGQGLLDWDFEASAAQLLTEAATPSGHDSGSDADMRMSGEVESNDGDSTEEELVDEHGLPTAPQLYSINPLSTMSPGPHVQDALSIQSPQPSDILAGHGFVDDDEDGPEPPTSEIGSTVLSASSDRGTPRFPHMGTFEASRTNSLRRAVIDGSPHAIPSPFQRSGRRRFSGSVSAQSASRGRDRSQSLSYASFTMSPTHFEVPSLSDDLTLPAPPCLPLNEPIRLDDVLDTSILDSDPADASATLSKPYSIIGETEASATDDVERHLHNLSRWDRIPMGTFRHTRESDGPSNLAYDDIIRSSPFNGVWSSDRGHNKSTGSPSRKGKGKRKGSLNMDISPVILPRDGDHTPPNGSTISQNSHNPLHSKPRKDKESRRDKVLKRKTLMGTAIGRRHQQPHHPHGHHPNSKGRASGSIQRTGVFSGSVPPLNL
ncbi:hypothetical protein EI94DRAFT_1720136 [Lactarius quietus]|nr:hypothetical protein EI94DRAFT_1720136 [Lactarius quietus]